jgi:hypothetical protein
MSWRPARISETALDGPELSSVRDSSINRAERSTAAFISATNRRVRSRVLSISALTSRLRLMPIERVMKADVSTMRGRLRRFELGEDCFPRIEPRSQRVAVFVTRALQQPDRQGERLAAIWVGHDGFATCQISATSPKCPDRGRKTDRNLLMPVARLRLVVNLNH